MTIQLTTVTYFFALPIPILTYFTNIHFIILHFTGNFVSVRTPRHTSTNVVVARNTQLRVNPKNFTTDPGSFIKLVSEDVFVDKTLLIHDFITANDKHVLITKPRKCGKTLVLDMLKTFFQPDVDDNGIFDFEINKYRQTFEALNINNKTVSIKNYDTRERHEVNTVQHFQGRYPVISITFSNKVAENQDILSGIKASISNAYCQHNYLLHGLYNIENDITQNGGARVIARNSIKLFEELSLHNGQEVSEFTLLNSIERLTILLHKHFHQRVHILIDNYDAPLNSNLSKKNYDKVLSTLLQIFHYALKDNCHVEKSFIIGQEQISELDIFSNFNFINKKYDEYFRVLL